MPYSPLLIKPFRDEVVSVGVQELLTPNDVDEIMKQTGTTLIFINSICSCAAATARPGIKLALEHDRKPDRVASVFAGQDLDATARFRTYVSDIPPSSPSFALFKDNELVAFIPKHRIEIRDSRALASGLMDAFDEFC